MSHRVEIVQHPPAKVQVAVTCLHQLNTTERVRLQMGLDEDLVYPHAFRLHVAACEMLTNYLNGELDDELRREADRIVAALDGVDLGDEVGDDQSDH